MTSILRDFLWHMVDSYGIDLQDSEASLALAEKRWDENLCMRCGADCDDSHPATHNTFVYYLCDECASDYPEPEIEIDE